MPFYHTYVSRSLLLFDQLRDLRSRAYSKSLWDLQVIYMYLWLSIVYCVVNQFTYTYYNLI